MEFENYKLDKEILKALSYLQYKNPSKVQEKAIPLLLDKKDLIVKSQTGSGKTASFGIPICNNINSEDTNIGALVLVPTRELAIQVKEELSSIGRLKKIRCAAIFGKQPFKEQERELKQRIHVVVGTPGRVIDHMQRGNLNFKSLSYVIVDEADKMMNMGFIDQIEEVLKRLPQKKVMALFSATLPEEIKGICEKYMTNPLNLEVNSEVINKPKIEESYLIVEDKDKLKALIKYFYALTPEAAMVFCNTRGKVKEVYESLKNNGISVEQLHGDMEQKVRINTMERFKAGEFRILVATDIAARGIDVDQITHVFNYEVPMERESYVHRIGRTGRAGREGTAITLSSKYEEKFIRGIEEFIDYKIPLGAYPTDEAIKLGEEKFKEKQKNCKRRTVKKELLQKEVTKIYLGAGKKKKIRNIDILGALSNLPELNGDDIGIIDVQDAVSYVDILNNKGKSLLKKYPQLIIKGKKVKIEVAKK